MRCMCLRWQEDEDTDKPKIEDLDEDEEDEDKEKSKDKKKKKKIKEKYTEVCQLLLVMHFTWHTCKNQGSTKQQILLFGRIGIIVLFG